MFIQDADLTSALRDVLQRAGGAQGNLRPFWNSIITNANNKAYWEIVERFMHRGYSKAIIDQWDRGAEFQRDIGLWWALEMGLAMDPETYNPEALKPYQLDRRSELETGQEQGSFRKGVLLTIGGVFVQPDTSVAQAVSGGFDTSGDMFVWPDPNDTRIGNPSKF